MVKVEEASVSKTEEQLVVFELASERYGVQIDQVQEIIRLPAITRLPKAPEFVDGVINLRGRVIPVVDLRTRFGLGRGERTKESRIVVVDVGGQTIGMVVDGVSEVLRIPGDAVEPPSPVATTVESAYIRGVAKLEGGLIILLDLSRVLSWDEKRALAEVS